MTVRGIFDGAVERMFFAKRKYWLWVILFLASQKSFAQADDPFDPNRRPTSFRLIDSIKQTVFVLDSSKTIITAFDYFAGKILWQTDPWKDKDGIPWMGVERPVIIYFGVEYLGFGPKKKWIVIDYNNTQEWIIDKETSSCQLISQD